MILSCEVSIIFAFLVTLVSAHFNSTKAIDVESFPGEVCFRDCSNASPRICYFDWHLEHYHVLGPACGSCGQPYGNVTDCFNEQCITADGIERGGVMSINRKIPGPPIHVCKDDLIVVDVTNKMGGTSSAIHWHGFHQRRTPYMDGVPYVTQCPIQYGTTFRYAFQASEPGTHFYHSHSGHHKVNGHYGGIVVRQNPKDEPNLSTYDEDLKEHLIVASDWMETDGETFMPGLRSSQIGIQPTNLLINGKGTRHNKTNGRSITGTPLEVFRVQRGQRYRFRFVNSMSHVCPAVLEVENHSLLMIASDSFPFQPVSVDSFVSTSGERYDFVINANQIGGMFWIRLRALGACEKREMEQFAILSYESPSVSKIRLSYPQRRFPDYSQRFGLNSRTLNHPNTTCGEGDLINLCITDLTSSDYRPDITNVEPDHKFTLGFTNHQVELGEESVSRSLIKQLWCRGLNKPRKIKVALPRGILELKSDLLINCNRILLDLHDDVVAVGVINKISTTFPSFSLLTQPEEIREDVFCDYEQKKSVNCSKSQICHCVHRLKVKMNSIVELTVFDESTEINTINHPFHLHGYQLFVMKMGQHPDKIPMTAEIAKTLAFERKSRSSFEMHAVKDTISIPSKGYTVFRFRADNPGWWLLHCHYEWHLAVGMGLILQVGEPDEMVKAPKNFPKCDNYKPPLDEGVLEFLKID